MNQTDANEITNIVKCNKDMVSFNYKGTSYVYYITFMDAFWGTVSKYDITLNPYAHDYNLFQKTGVVGRWDPENNTAMLD